MDEIQKRIKRNHDLKSFRRKVRFRQQKKLRNKALQGLSHEKKKERQLQDVFNKQFVGYKVIKAQQSLFVHNT